MEYDILEQQARYSNHLYKYAKYLAEMNLSKQEENLLFNRLEESLNIRYASLVEAVADIDIKITTSHNLDSNTCPIGDAVVTLLTAYIEVTGLRLIKPNV